MFLPGMSKTNNMRRVLSAVVVLFVFFLPFHFHFSGTPQLNKECGCLQGTRTQLAQATDTAKFDPTFQIEHLSVQIVAPMAHDWKALENVRAPPDSLSV
jgi:hypothetical protein